MNNTDQQVSEILASLSEIAPGVAEQALAYAWINNLVGLVIFTLLTLSCLGGAIYCFCNRHLDDSYTDDYTMCAFMWAVVGCILGLITTVIGLELVKIHIAPKLYLVEHFLSLI